MKGGLGFPLKTLMRKGVWLRGWSVLVGVLALLVAMVPSSSLAEGSLRLKQVSVSLMPEYDDPRVLVMYTGEVTQGTSLPVQIKFRVPSKVAMTATCSIYPNGKHSNEPYDLKEDDGYATVTYRLTEPKFHVEFYAKAPEGQTDKSFSYDFQSFFPIDNLEFGIQQPLRATNFNVTPAAQPAGTDSEGFQFYHLTYSDVKPDDKPVQLKVSYTKTDPNPSKAKGQSGTGGSKNDDYKPLLVLIGVMMAGAIGYFAFSSYRRRRLAPAYSRPATRAARREMAMAAVGGSGGIPKSVSTSGGRGFCSNCGASLDKDDRFCPSCGRKSKRRA